LCANIFHPPASRASTTTTSTHTSFCSIEQAQSSHGTQKWYFLSGKFDAIQNIDLFHGLVKAFNGFCEQVVGGKVHGRARITEAIQEAIDGSDHAVQAGSKVIPSLATLFYCQTSDTASSSIFTAKTNQSNHRECTIYSRTLCEPFVRKHIL
jgi:hypothetical protein